VPPSDDMAGESFRGLILRLRSRTGLTQRELAARIGVHVSSIQGWEAGPTYPSVASLQALIAAGVQGGGFTAGHEHEEAQVLWAAALRDAPRFRMPFDGTWFERLVAGRLRPVRDDTESLVAAPPSPAATIGGARRESWGEAPDVVGFVGRASERALLRRWVLDERSRVVAVLGLGGIGKSLLVTRVANDLAPSFDRIFWRSLRDAPTPGEWLAQAVRFLAPNGGSEAGGEPALLRWLLALLGETRCLLVLDNVETVLQPGRSAGEYRPGYERYGTLLRQVAEAPHRSCVVITSREEPPELGPLREEHGPVRIYALTGLRVEDGRALLSDKQLDGDEAAWQALVGHCGGNGLALRVVGETTRELFGGSIADFLEFATGTAGMTVAGVRQLLRDQIQRLSDPEQEVLRRMAVEREPVGLMELAADFGPRIGRAATFEAVDGLRRRSLLERTERGPLFSLHSVVLEYVTDQLVEDVTQELASGDLACLLRQPLLKATAKEYVRRSQERLIAAPIVDRLVGDRGSAPAVEQRILSLLDTQRGRPMEDQGYGPGNLVNVLRLLRGDLKDVDLSGLSIRQAYLQDVDAQGASLAKAHLSDSVLGEAFSYPTSLALSADGAFLVAGMAGGDVCRWRVADRTLVATLPGHAGPIWDVALSGDGRLVASGGIDGTVRLWGGEEGRPLATLQGHTGGVWGVALSGDGRLVASGGADGTVRLWGGEGRRPLAVLQAHPGGVWGVALSGDGRLLASGGADGTVRLWEVTSGRLLAGLKGRTGGVRGVALSRDGRLVASDGSGRTVQLWETEDGKPLAALHGHARGVRGVALSGDGRLIASASLDRTVRLWETDSGKPLAALRGRTSGVPGVALSRDGRLIVSGSIDGTVRFWKTESGRRLTAVQGHADGLAGVALSGDGRLVASGGADGTVRLWETEGGRLLAALRGHIGDVFSVSMSEDGRLVASGGDDGTVRLWEVASGRPLATLRGHAGEVRLVALSRDGRLVASVGLDATVRLWDSENERLLDTLRGHAGGVHGVALSADSRLVASGGVDGTVRLWEASSGRPLAALRGHAGGVRGVSLSVDGRLAASGGDDGTVRLWETESGRLLATLHGHTGEVFSVVLSEDARLTASGGEDGTVRLWETSTGTCLRVLREDRRYERVDITGLTGVTEAQRQVLLVLGAVEQSDQTTPSAVGPQR